MPYKSTKNKIIQNMERFSKSCISNRQPANGENGSLNKLEKSRWSAT